MLIDNLHPIGVVDRSLDVEAVSALVAVPKEDPEGADEVGLTELYKNVAAVELVASVAYENIHISDFIKKKVPANSPQSQS